MVGRVEKRREERVAGIVACAWKLAGEHGIAGLTLHALAREVGIRQPSLYEYFESKNALYDAMFAAGNRQLLDRVDTVDLSPEPRTALKQILAAFVRFALEDPARYELLFQRHVPGFEPSAESYALAQKALDRILAVMQAAGVRDPGDIDCIVAVTAGLTDAQLSNEPTGDRWIRHLNHLVDLVVDDAIQRSSE